MMRIAAFSRKFPPDFKRRWYIVEYNNSYRIRSGRRLDTMYKLRYNGVTARFNGEAAYFVSRNDALNLIEMLNEWSNNAKD